MNLPFNLFRYIFNYKLIIKQPMVQDDITIERIKKSHPKIREQLKLDYLECNNKILGKGIRLRLAQVYRTFAEQDALYAQGRTKPGLKVTNAKGGQSIHNYGLAFDIVLLYDLNGDGTFETASWDRHRDFDNDKKADWMEVVEFFKLKGYSWGGDWRSFKDYPHFEKNFGYGWKDLQKMKKDNNGYVIF
jgi:peptidoglycan L-alanyl-D-glutamate endopeptidase CwlK